jgi:D-3-phosphoglycerate dehydrogenase
MLRIAVLDDYQGVARRMADWDALGGDVAIEVFREHLPPAAAAARLQPYEVLCLMRERLPLPAALLAALPRLRLVVVTGARTRSIDLAAAAARGITVCHTSAGESAQATPELAWGLILALARRIAEEDARLRAGGWQATIGTVLAGKTLGLLGLGKLGARMVPIARAFGMTPIAWSPNLTAERAAMAGAELVDREALFARADVLSIHMVLSERTRGLVGAAELARMKPTALLINTSRGPLVDEAVLIAALRAGRIAGAGLDVFDQEPLPADSPWRSMPNTVLTPHLGYVTEGAYRAFYADTVAAIAAWRAGRPIRVLAAGPA